MMGQPARFTDDKSNQSGYDMASADDIRKVLAGKKPPQQKLAKIARLVAVPEPLTYVVLSD